MTVAIYAAYFGYPILQYLAIRWTEGWWRRLAWLPLLPTILILAATIVGVVGPTHSMALLGLLAPPLAFMYLVLLLVARRLSRPSSRAA